MRPPRESLVPRDRRVVRGLGGGPCPPVTRAGFGSRSFGNASYVFRVGYKVAGVDVWSVGDRPHARARRRASYARRRAALTVAEWSRPAAASARAHEPKSRRARA